MEPVKTLPLEQQYSKFIPDYEPPTRHRRCGLYIRRPAQPPLAIPLRSIDYNINITSSLCEVSVIQQYSNPIDSFLQVEFCIPVDPKACIRKFRAIFEDRVVQGIVKQKQQAVEEYKQALSQGREVALGTLNSQSSDILNIQIGNIGPKENVRVEIGYLQELEVSVNVFWKLLVSSHISPRCTAYQTPRHRDFDGVSKKKMAPMQIEVPSLVPTTRSLEYPDYTWTFKINIKSSEAIAFCRSPTHELLQLSISQDRKETLLVMQQSCIPTKDFSFLFSTENFAKPSVVVGKTDLSATALISFIPQFGETVNMDDAYRSSIENKTVEFDLEQARGQYIFLIDRSGSMSGNRIERAKEALAFFLRSLPQDCYFDIYSFGDRYNAMFGQPTKYSEDSLSKAIKIVKGMKADMGGTVIGGALQKIFSNKLVEGYPKQIFLLTDGAVSNTNDVIEIVARNTKHARVHTIGIGNGCSQALIKGCSEKGKGQHIFIQDNDNVSAKIIGLLSTAMSPVISEFGVDFDTNAIESITPNPKDMPYILKEQAVNLYVIFKPGFEGSSMVRFYYIDPRSKSKISTESNINTATQNGNYLVNKVAHFKTITKILEALKYGTELGKDILIAQLKDARQYAIQQSIKHQVLCEATAFLAVGKSLSDGKLQEYLGSKLEKVVVPQPQTSSPRAVAAMMGMRMKKSAPISNLSSSSSIGSAKVIEYKKSTIPVQRSRGMAQQGCKQSMPKMMKSAAMPVPRLAQKQLQQSMVVEKKQMMIAPMKSCEVDDEEEMFAMMEAEMKKSEVKKKKMKEKREQTTLENKDLKKDQFKMQKQEKTSPVSLDIKVIIEKQKITGEWDPCVLPQILKALNLSNSDIEPFKALKTELIVTILVGEWLSKVIKSAEYSLLVKKSKSWVKRFMTQNNLKQEDVDSLYKLVQSS